MGSGITTREFRNDQNKRKETEMKRLTHEADFGLEEWEQTLYSVNSDQGGAYNILDIANHKGEEEFDEILKTISLGLKHYEDTGLTPEQIRELKERDTAKIVNLIPFDGCDDDSDITYKAYCPICKRYIGILFKKGYKGKGDNFCRNCGQRLKWEK